jgi:hypothetical protein
MAALYYNPRTSARGSPDPLRHSQPMRNVRGTGWGPRGDSGSARGRVRATQPAFLNLVIPSNSQISVRAVNRAPFRGGLERHGPCI